MPRRVPPAVPSCAADNRIEPPRIVSPLRDVAYSLRADRPQDVIPLEAVVAAGVARVYWFDGNALIGSRPAGDGALPWRPATAGAHLIRVIDDQGRSAERDVIVTLRGPRPLR